MGNSAAVRHLVDLLMTVVLILLMAYFLTEQEIHEWLGAGMLVLFIAHHILNRKWLKALNRGKYTPFRVLQTALALLVLLCMLGSMLSGIWMSRYVFDFLPTQGHMGLARTAHLLCAYWGFLLLSAHLGLHWGIMLGAARKAVGNKKPSALRTAVLRVLAAVISGYGVYAFFKHQIADYLFLRSHFVFFDYEQPPALYVLDLLAFGSHCLTTWAKHFGAGRDTPLTKVKSRRRISHETPRCTAGASCFALLPNSLRRKSHITEHL